MKQTRGEGGNSDKGEETSVIVNLEVATPLRSHLTPGRFPTDLEVGQTTSVIFSNPRFN